MRRLILIVMLMIASLALALAQETPPPTPAPETPKSTLVDAARKTKSARKKSTTRVITNKDVKKSTGKLMMLSPSTLPEDKKPASKIGTIEEQDALLRARKEADQILQAAEKAAAELEKELHGIEQSFYAENDLAFRDHVIRKRFDEASLKVAEANKIVADAREHRQSLDPPQP